jgi:CBS domain-containing protein
MRAKDIMTPSPSCCSPDDAVRDVARVMRDNDCGAVPIVERDSGRLVGIVTDRDLAIRALADDRGGSTKVSEVMTANPSCCRATEDVRNVEATMAEHQVRRVPITDADGRCVGIVAQADLAREALHGERLTDREVAIVVERISEPSRPSSGRPSFADREVRL